MNSKKLAMYIRLSKEDLDVTSRMDKIESNSVSNQRNLLMDYYRTHAELHSYELVEFVDDGFSGTNFERPQFDAMLKQIRTGQIQCVMVKDLSRFGRNYLEVGNYLDMILPLYGTRFISVTDNIDTDRFKGLTGGMDVALRNLINGLYSIDLSKKVRSSLRIRNKRGDYLGGSAFYGYKLDPNDKKHLLVDESVRSIIEMIYSDCLAGMTTRKIAAKLNDMGIPSPLAYKRQNGGLYNGRVAEEQSYWIQATVRRILTDERYTGKMVSYTREREHVGSNRTIPVPRQDWIIVPGTHEAIISDEVFTKAQNILESHKRGSNSGTSGYKKGSIFVCGYCGRRLQKNIGTAANYLRCPKSDTVKGTPCENVHPVLSKLERAVLELLRANFNQRLNDATPSLDDRDAALCHIRDKRKQAATELARIKGRKTELYEKYRSGKISRESYQIIRDQDARAKSACEDMINQCDEEERKTLSEGTLTASSTGSADKILSVFDPLVISDLIRRVTVFGDNRIEVEFKFREG